MLTTTAFETPTIQANILLHSQAAANYDDRSRTSGRKTGPRCGRCSNRFVRDAREARCSTSAAAPGS